MAPAENATPTDLSTKKRDPDYPLSTESLGHLVQYHLHGNELFNSIRARVSMPAGSHICYITAHSPASKPSWNTVQTGPDSHVELNSAVLYTEHSCDPNTEFRLFRPDALGNYPRELPYALPAGQPSPKPGKFGIAGEVRVASHKDLEAGQDLCFFYPSSEWDFSRPFECLCNAPKDMCLRSIQGAKYLSRETLERYHVNAHIWKLVGERDRAD